MKSAELQNIIEYHYRLQYGCFFSEIVESESALYTYNDVMECFIWNHVFPCGEEYILNDVIQVAEKYFYTRSRKTCVYLDEFNNSPRNKNVLDIAGYKCVDHESWMIYPNSKKIKDISDNVFCVNTVADLKRFCSVCTECFGNQYSVAIEREYDRFQVHKRVSHFLLSVDGADMGIGSIYSSGEYAFIHNVGIKEKQRQNGYGSQMVRFLIGEVFSKCPSNVKLILQCDGDSFIENMYLKLGFENIYRRWGYLK